MIQCCKCVDFILLMLCLAASLVGLTTNYWIEHDNTNHQGIWFYCNDEEVGCVHFDQDPQVIANGGVPGKFRTDIHISDFHIELTLNSRTEDSTGARLAFCLL